MFIRYGFRITIATNAPTAVLTRLDVHPDRRPDIRQEGRFTISGFDVEKPFVDLHGNLCRRVTAFPGDAILELSGVVEDSGAPEWQIYNEAACPIANLPKETLPYLLASRYCETDKLSQMAWNLFGHYAEGASRVRAVVDYVHNRLTFGYGFARSTRTAAEALDERVGVCRDFAHTTIALCRALNIPARYVNGYLGDIGVPKDPAPMDFSAWVEVFLDGRWYTVDARHNYPRAGRIVIARGRDAADVPMVHTFGPHWLNEFLVITEELPGDSALQKLDLAA
jgi:transglutaminase-like putative cysteine protease